MSGELWSYGSDDRTQEQREQDYRARKAAERAADLTSSSRWPRERDQRHTVRKARSAVDNIESYFDRR